MLLAPFGWIYGAVTAWRMARPGMRANLPVICIGNLTAGGAGKTPTVAMLAEALQARGERPFVVSRGYGGRLEGPIRVDPSTMTASDCGDEPLLLARRLPVIVSRDRYAGAGLAEAEGASVVLLDDGLQNPKLAKDFTVAVVDGGQRFGNGLCIPAGPLRAPVEAQMRHVDAMLVIGHLSGDPAPTSSKPQFKARISPDAAVVRTLAARPVLAFAGIGRPEKFFETLARAGVQVAGMRAFADHHPFSEADVESLRAEARASGLSLVTTEKDATRLPGEAGDIAVLPISLDLEDERLVTLVVAAIARRRSERRSA